VTIDVVEPGLLTSVQDAVGRDRWRHLGVPQGGAVDPWSAWLANRLVANPEDAGVLEMTMIGPVLRFGEPATIALVGRLDATVDGLPLPVSTARSVRAGAILKVGSGDGARAWLAVRGGIDVPEVLGSRSTELRAGFGGFEGRPLRAGDRIPVGRPSAGQAGRWVGAQPEAPPIRVLSGLHPGDGLAELLEGEYRAGVDADRSGVRLDGPSLPGGEVPSVGLPLGAIQVPPDGRPIVMLADRPVTGGYRVPAVVIGADIGRIAQLRPDDPVRFARVSLGEARVAWRDAMNELAAIEPLAAAEDDELGCAVFLGDVDRRALERAGELRRDEDLQPFLLGDLVALGRPISEAEADGDLSGLGRLRKDPDAVGIRHVLALAELGQQGRGPMSDLKHVVSLVGGTRVSAARPIPALCGRHACCGEAGS
jgi:5-oxoprolinase (ATP-hydrolysing) subunit C